MLQHVQGKLPSIAAYSTAYFTTCKALRVLWSFAFETDLNFTKECVKTKNMSVQ